MENIKSKKPISWKRRMLVGFAIFIGLAGLLASAGMYYILTNSEMDPGGSGMEKVDKDGFASVDWKKWQTRNPDVIGWINIPDTNINYPIVKAHQEDPQFYLHHDIDRNYSVLGVPYLDADCNGKLLTSPNAVLFGHHIVGSRLFAQVALYSDKGYAKEHRDVYIQTPEHKVVWRVFAADIINAYVTKEYTTFNTMEQFDKWCEKIYNDADVQLSEPDCDRVVTLVTCSYHYFANERTLVYVRPYKVDGQKVDIDDCIKKLGATDPELADSMANVAESIEMAIKAIDAIGPVDFSSGEAIEVAEYLVSRLSYVDKQKVTNLPALEDAKKAYEAAKAVKAVRDDRLGIEWTQG